MVGKRFGQVFFSIFLFWGVLAGEAFAHNCQLEGNDGVSISKYNQCKADLNYPNMHKNLDNSDQNEEMAKLQAENQRLRLQLQVIKQQLLDMLKNL